MEDKMVQLQHLWSGNGMKLKFPENIKVQWKTKILLENEYFKLGSEFNCGKSELLPLKWNNSNSSHFKFVPLRWSMNNSVKLVNKWSAIRSTIGQKNNSSHFVGPYGVSLS